MRVSITINLKYLFTVIAGICVVALALIPLAVKPADIGHWTVWIWVFACTAVASITWQTFVQAREDRKRDEREAERDSREQERDLLLRKLVAEHEKTPTSSPNPISTQLSSSDGGVTADDPQLYFDIEEPKPGVGFRTPLLVQNRGNLTAHCITVKPFKLKRKTVTFHQISEIAPGAQAEVLPSIEGAGTLLSRDIFHWLVQDWDGNGELTDDWPIQLVVDYTDPFGRKRFQETVTLLFHPIKHIMFRKTGADGERPFPNQERTVEFTDYKFKLLAPQ